MNNTQIIQKFFTKGYDGFTHSKKNIRFQEGTLYSFNFPLAKLVSARNGEKCCLVVSTYSNSHICAHARIVIDQCPYPVLLVDIDRGKDFTLENAIAKGTENIKHYGLMCRKDHWNRRHYGPWFLKDFSQLAEIHTRIHSVPVLHKYKKLYDDVAAAGITPSRSYYLVY